MSLNDWIFFSSPGWYAFDVHVCVRLSVRTACARHFAAKSLYVLWWIVLLSIITTNIMIRRQQYAICAHISPAVLMFHAHPYTSSTNNSLINNDIRLYDIHKIDSATPREYSAIWLFTVSFDALLSPWLYWNQERTSLKHIWVWTKWPPFADDI